VRKEGPCILAALAMLLLACGVAPGQAGNKQEVDALVKQADAFVAAFNKGDATALAGFWTPEGLYRDQKGREVKGRDAITKEFESFFSHNKGLKLRINIGAFRFVTPDVVVEEGTTEVLHPDGSPPSPAAYVMLHVKKDDKWYIDIVKENIYLPPTNFKHLGVLEWAIGDWADEAEKGNVGRLSLSWGPNQNFIVGSFATTFKNISLSSGTQWIGWDAKNKQIRAWTFDNNGSIGEGTWSHKGDKWVVKTQTTLRDGKTVLATNIITPIDAQTMSWQSTERSVDGNSLPDIPPIRMKRVK
jgi:uncharacterized protein (TIGR02246 family)